MLEAYHYKLPVDPTYRWQTNDGLRLRPTEMKTPHLYHTVCMLWHHTMPPDAELHPHKKWRLGPRFTEEFTRISIAALLMELLTRDRTTYHWPTIEKMFLYLKRNQNRLDKGPLRITSEHPTDNPPNA